MSTLWTAEQGLPVRGIIVSKAHPEYLLVGDFGVTDVLQLRPGTVDEVYDFSLLQPE